MYCVYIYIYTYTYYVLYSIVYMSYIAQEARARHRLRLRAARLAPRLDLLRRLRGHGLEPARPRLRGVRPFTSDFPLYLRWVPLV